ncbi:Lsr2 family DNA-binding protein [Nocardia niwae]|uniref:Histone-like nucleoid-structuring protein Lsr2 n=1 Tax=Nocardia niwae TaxID=626084 RepID=A0ABV2XKL3_9NOCA
MVQHPAAALRGRIPAAGRIRTPLPSTDHLGRGGLNTGLHRIQDGSPDGSRRRSKNIESAAQATPQPGVVREWARANGYTVPRRGRVPANVVAAYEKAAS